MAKDRKEGNEQYARGQAERWTEAILGGCFRPRPNTLRGLLIAAYLAGWRLGRGVYR